MTVPYGKSEIREMLMRLESVTADALENQWLDFKEWPSREVSEKANIRAQRKTAIEAAVCFANAEGGTAVFGVKDDVIGIVDACEGVPRTTDTESLERSIIDSTKPPVFPKLEWLEVNGGANPLLLMFIEPAKAPPCSSSEGWSVRVNKNCISLDGNLLRPLYFPDASASSSRAFADQVVEMLLKVLRGNDSRDANTAVKGLAKIGEASMNELIAQWLLNSAEDGDINVIERVRNTWTSMRGDRDIAEYVISCLANYADDRLPAFMAAAAVIGPEEAVDSLGSIMKVHPRSLVRAQAVRSLAEVRDQRALELLIEQLSVELDIGVLKELMDRIEIGPDSLPGFCSLIRHQAWPIRERAARALGDAGSGEPAIIRSLDEATEDLQTEVVLAAINSLKMIDAEAAEVALKRVLDDSGRALEIRGAAMQALTELRRKHVDAEPTQS